MADRFFARRGPFSLEFLADAVDGDLDAETDRRALIRDAAALDSSTAVGAGCRIDADAVIGAGVELGERCKVGARAVIGAGRVVGADCRIGAGVTIGHALIGAWVRIWPDARIRQPSFDFVPGASGLERGPQLGRVIIGDDLESGANATIDRGTTGDTEIGPAASLIISGKSRTTCGLGRVASSSPKRGFRAVPGSRITWSWAGRRA